MRPGPAKAGLHFIGNAQAAGGADVLVSMFEIIIRKYNAAPDALNGFGDECRDLAGGSEVEQVLHIGGVIFARVDIIASPCAAIRIWSNRMMHAEAVRYVKFPGAMRSEPHGQRISSVIAVTQRNDIVMSGVRARHEQGQIVRLRPGVDEVTNLQIARHL